MKRAVMCWRTVILVLMTGTGCVLFKTDEERNEVVHELNQAMSGCMHGFVMTCIEQTTTLADNLLKTSDVCIEHVPFMLQTYRIEGHKVINYYWSDYLLYGVRHLQEDDKKQVAWNECDALLNKIWVVRKAYKQLPNRLKQGEPHPQPLGRDPVVTITHMDKSPNPSDSQAFVHWNNWTAWQWRGPPNGIPEEIETFRQNVVRVVSAPKYARHYHSYVRAIPLFSKDTLEAEKDTPLIDVEKTRYHIRSAVRYPYLLIPVPEKKSPFPAVQEYTPGDKFKVRQDYNGKPNYFLIETFKGESWEK